MTWKKRLGIGCGGALALVVVAAAGFWIWKPWIPAVEMTDPGPAGQRVTVAGGPANWFPASGPGRHPAVLVLGGSEGALGGGPANIARGLQRGGFSALQFAYFRAPGQSHDLVRIPLERFDSAIDWLKARPDVDPARIMIVGGSKGAEAALIVASRRTDIAAVVAGMPSSVAWPGFSWTSGGIAGSSWTLGRKDVPALPYGRGSFSDGIGSVYRSGLIALPQHPEAVIRIEQSKAPVLLVCGEADTLWPSCPMARQLAQRDPRVTVLAYRDAGHGVFGIPVKGSAPKRLAGFGGTPDGNNRARAESWPKVLQFLRGAEPAGG